MGGAGQSSAGPVGPSVGPGPSSADVTVGPGPGPGPGPSVVASSGAGGQLCDGQSDCQSCADCALKVVCGDIWNKCLATPDCANLADCIANCPDNQCTQKCAQAFPGGVELYNNAAFCVVCQACFFDCGGSSQGCP